MERWQGRVALVTGGSAGIGAEICRELAEHKMRVVACARSVDRIRAIAEELPEGSLHAIKCDLSKEEDIASLFSEIREKYGRLDVCVNNAAFSTDCPLLSGKTSEWREMLEVNVLALCVCTREAIQIMRENNIDDGQIINIGSIAGHEIFAEAAFYCGTKFMVRALTETLRQELRQLKSNIRVASISPGLVKTEFIYRFVEDRDKADTLMESAKHMSANDIASLVINILQTPPHVDVNDIIVRPVG